MNRHFFTKYGTTTMNTDSEATALVSLQTKPLDDAKKDRDTSNVWDCQLLLKVSSYPSNGLFDMTDVML
jgi:hypothetical protein